MKEPRDIGRVLTGDGPGSPAYKRAIVKRDFQLKLREYRLKRKNYRLKRIGGVVAAGGLLVTAAWYIFSK